tara:strand:+ start:833 stop:1879 length:1047 start_codon:yes stop_codon:yes gene_type:complete
MKLYKSIIIILIVFLKTGNLLSENNLFNVNNIELVKKDNVSTNALTNRAIKSGFDQLIRKILLEDDIKKLSELNFSEIKQLVTFYQISNSVDNNSKEELVNFSVTFDKDKVHNLFFKRNILYSEITDKELYILPILIENDEIYVFNNNFFYSNWNEIYKENLIEFILPLENIEIIQNINNNRNNLINLNVKDLFKEYLNKNLALILIENNKADFKKIYLKAIIQGKNISKNLNFKKQKQDLVKFNETIIKETKNEITNLVKSENLIDIRTPSFLNVKMYLNKKTNFVELNSIIKNIDLIENVYVQDFNKDYMNLRIKYLGKLNKIMQQLKNKSINLELINESWIIRSL